MNLAQSREQVTSRMNYESVGHSSKVENNEILEHLSRRPSFVVGKTDNRCRFAERVTDTNQNETKKNVNKMEVLFKKKKKRKICLSVLKEREILNYYVSSQFQTKIFVFLNNFNNCIECTHTTFYVNSLKKP